MKLTLEDLKKQLLMLIDPFDYYETNCTQSSNIFDQPSARYFLQHISGSQLILLLIASVFTIIVLIIAFLHWYFVRNYMSEEKRRNIIYFLITLFPISTLCCWIGMISPRSSMIMTSFGVLYFLLCLLVLISLIRHLFGDRNAFSLTLINDDRPIDLQSPPICCCCPFLPKFQSTVRNLRRLEWLVLQAPMIRVIIVVFNVIAITEWRESANRYLHWSEMISVLSLLLAIFGTHTLARLAASKLSHYGFLTIFRVVDIALLFFTAQQPIIFDNLLIRLNIFECGPILSPQDNARFLCNFIIITEMLLIELFISFSMAPSRTALFDLYGDKTIQRLQSETTDESLLTSTDSIAQMQLLNVLQ